MLALGRVATSLDTWGAARAHKQDRRTSPDFNVSEVFHRHGEANATRKKVTHQEGSHPLYLAFPGVVDMLILSSQRDKTAWLKIEQNCRSCSKLDSATQTTRAQCAASDCAKTKSGKECPQQRGRAC